MNVGDKVFILDCKNKYVGYDLKGSIATIVNVYGSIDPNYALKVDNLRNEASRDGLFYLKAGCLLRVHIPSGYPMLRCSSRLDTDDLMQHEAFIKKAILNSAFNSTISIKKVIFNRPATIVIWSDGTKTVVKKQKGDRWDEEKGLAMCIIKKLSGNTGCYYELFKRYCNA